MGPWHPIDLTSCPVLLQIQLLFLAGLATTIGFKSTVQFFLRKKNRKVTGMGGGNGVLVIRYCIVHDYSSKAATLQGSAFYLGGCGLVVYGWTVVGLVLEAYGFWLLFCEFFPTVLQASVDIVHASRLD